MSEKPPPAPPPAQFIRQGVSLPLLASGLATIAFAALALVAAALRLI